MAFIMLCSLYPTFWGVFIINGYWILSKAFSASIEMAYYSMLTWVFLPMLTYFHFVILVIMMRGRQILKAGAHITIFSKGLNTDFLKSNLARYKRLDGTHLFLVVPCCSFQVFTLNKAFKFHKISIFVYSFFVTEPSLIWLNLYPRFLYSWNQMFKLQNIDYIDYFNTLSSYSREIIGNNLQL